MSVFHVTLTFYNANTCLSLNTTLSSFVLFCFKHQNFTSCSGSIVVHHHVNCVFVI